MSVMELDDITYDDLHRETVKRYEKHYEPFLAEIHARDLMQHCFRRRTTSIQCEYEADYAEYIEDMSLGGQPFEPYRTR